MMRANRKWLQHELYKLYNPKVVPSELTAFNKQVKRLEAAKTFNTIGCAADEARKIRRRVWRRVCRSIGFNAMDLMFNGDTTIEELLFFEDKIKRFPSIVERCRAV